MEWVRALGGFFRAYAWSTLTILFLVYWSQGFKHFGVLALAYFFEDTLKLEPASAQYVFSLGQLAWYFKPLYGMISDNFPIYGNHRKPYLCLAGLLGLFAYLSFLQITTPFQATLALLLSELSQALANVICDAIIMQESRRTGCATSTTLQTWCLVSMSLGGLIGGPLGGMALERFPPAYVLASQTVCPCLLLLAAVLYREEYQAMGVQKGIWQRCRGLNQALMEPKVLRPVLFLFLVYGCTPGIGQVIVYFYRDSLHFTATFISIVQTMGYATFGLGGLLYTQYLQHLPYRDILQIGHMLVFFFSLFELALVTRLNTLLYFADTWTAVMGDSFLTTLSFTLRSMPLTVVSCAICPLGAEATLFSLISSIQYMALVCSEAFGGFLTGILDVREGKYENLWVLLVVKSMLGLVPLMFLELIPDNPESGSETQELVQISSV
jgi:hypothetical protein